jgi:hypothetical protein
MAFLEGRAEILMCIYKPSKLNFQHETEARQATRLCNMIISMNFCGILQESDTLCRIYAGK